MYPKGNLIIPASHGQFEAIIKKPDGDSCGAAVVCHPHPLFEGTMHNKVVFRAAAGLVDAGLTTFRFNYSGVGASSGQHRGIEGGRSDVREVLDYVAKSIPGAEITLAGFSFGARTGLEVALDDERVARLISIGTPVDKYGDFEFLERNRKPILFVQGDKDDFGAVDNVRKLAAAVGRSAEVEVVVFADCGHFFDDHLASLRKTVADWVSGQMNVSGPRVGA